MPRDAPGENIYSTTNAQKLVRKCEINQPFFGEKTPQESRWVLWVCQSHYGSLEQVRDPMTGSISEKKFTEHGDEEEKEEKSWRRISIRKFVNVWFENFWKRETDRPVEFVVVWKILVPFFEATVTYTNSFLWKCYQIETTIDESDSRKRSMLSRYTFILNIRSRYWQIFLGGWLIATPAWWKWGK